MILSSISFENFNTSVAATVALVIAGGIVTYIIDSYKKKRKQSINKETEKTPPKPPCNVLSSFSPINANEIIGRENDLTQIALKLENTNTILLLNGMGGIGKTTLATLYAQQHKEEYDNFVWINAAQGIYIGFVNDTTLAHNLDLTNSLTELQKEHPNEFEQKGFELIVNVLLNKENGLLIIDNEQNQLPIVNYVKGKLQGSGKWKILLTARETLTGIEPYEVDVLDEEDARTLFYQYYTKEKDDVLVDEINQLLLRHTLMVELLARTAQNRDEYTLQQLKTDLETTKLNFAKDDTIESNHWGAGDEKTQRLYAFLQTAFTIAEFEEQENDTEEQKTKKQLLRQLLTYWCLMPERQVVKFSLFCKLCSIDEETDKSETNTLLKQLTQTGWLQHDTVNSEYLMHPVIQQALLWQLQPKPKDVDELINGIHNQTDYHFFEKYTLIGTKPLQPFVQNILGYFLNDKLFPKKDYNENWENISKLLNNFCVYYKAIGYYELAIEYHLKDINIRKKVYGEIVSETAVSYNNIAMVYQSKGDLENALKFATKALKIFEEILDIKHPNLATLYNNMALIHMSLRNWANAEEFAKKGIAIDREVLNNKHPDLATSYNNIAVIYKGKGDLTSALKFIDKAIKIREEVLENKHPDLATSYNSIATIYYEMGEYPTAKTYIDNAIGILEYCFPDGHPNLDISRNWQKIINEKMNA